MTNLGLFHLTDFCHLGAPDLFLSPWEGLSLLWVALLVNSRRLRLVAAAWRENTTTYYCFIQEWQPPPIVWRKRRNTCFTLSNLPYFIPTYKRDSHSSYWAMQSPVSLQHSCIAAKHIVSLCTSKIEALKNKVAQGNLKSVVQKRLCILRKPL